jgi:hypothetical protein
MTRLRTRRLSALLGLCIAFFVVQVAGVHLHLCMDGQEAPSSLHLSDAGLHEDHHDDGDHDDLDLTGLWNVLAKKPQAGFDLPVLITGLLASFMPVVLPVTFSRSAEPRITHADSRFYRPPLRAPPA